MGFIQDIYETVTPTGMLKKAGRGKQEAHLAQQQQMARPERVQFTGLTDQAGNLQDRFKLSGGEGYTAIANKRLQQDLAKGKEEAAAQAAGAQAQARNQLASRGGLGSGTAALLARQGMTDQLNALQGVTQKGIEGGQGIAEKQFDIGREAEKANVANLIGNQQALNQYNLGMYGQDMAAWGANQTANAQIRASKPKGGILCGVGSVLGK